MPEGLHKGPGNFIRARDFARKDFIRGLGLQDFTRARNFMRRDFARGLGLQDFVRARALTRRGFVRGLKGLEDFPRAWGTS